MTNRRNCESHEIAVVATVWWISDGMSWKWSWAFAELNLINFAQRDSITTPVKPLKLSAIRYRSGRIINRSLNDSTIFIQYSSSHNWFSKLQLVNIIGHNDWLSLIGPFSDIIFENFSHANRKCKEAGYVSVGRKRGHNVVRRSNDLSPSPSPSPPFPPIARR